MNSIGQPSVLSPTVSPDHSLQNAAFRKQLAGLSGFGQQESPYLARGSGSVAPRTRHGRTAHGPRDNYCCRDADSPAYISSLQLLEPGGGELDPCHRYSSDVSFEHYVDYGQNQVN